MQPMLDTSGDGILGSFGGPGLHGLCHWLGGTFLLTEKSIMSDQF